MSLPRRQITLSIILILFPALFAGLSGLSPVLSKAEQSPEAPRKNPSAGASAGDARCSMPDKLVGVITTTMIGQVLTNPSQARALFVCFACHDGSIAPSMGNKVQINPFDVSENKGGDQPFRTAFDHPVGMNYQLSRMRRPYAKLRSAASLPVCVKLEPDGTVGCTTCHNPISPSGTKLVMENIGSQLCLACHDL